MKFILRIVLFLPLVFSVERTTAQTRTKVNFGSDWEFKREEANVGKSDEKLTALDKMILYGKSKGYRFVTIEKMK